MTIYPKVAEINIETGKTVIREKTPDEKIEYDLAQNASATAQAVRLAEEQTFLTDRANGLAKLEAAGLTPAEAKAVARKNR